MHLQSRNIKHGHARALTSEKRDLRAQQAQTYRTHNVEKQHFVLGRAAFLAGLSMLVLGEEWWDLKDHEAARCAVPYAYHGEANDAENNSISIFSFFFFPLEEFPRSNGALWHGQPHPSSGHIVLPERCEESRLASRICSAIPVVRMWNSLENTGIPDVKLYVITSTFQIQLL